jgi:hypothetical protein
VFDALHRRSTVNEGMLYAFDLLELFFGAALLALDLRECFVEQDAVCGVVTLPDQNAEKAS